MNLIFIVFVVFLTLSAHGKPARNKEEDTTVRGNEFKQGDPNSNKFQASKNVQSIVTFVADDRGHRVKSANNSDGMSEIIIKKPQIVLRTQQEVLNKPATVSKVPQTVSKTEHSEISKNGTTVKLNGNETVFDDLYDDRIGTTLLISLNGGG